MLTKQILLEKKKIAGIGKSDTQKADVMYIISNITNEIANSKPKETVRPIAIQSRVRVVPKQAKRARTPIELTSKHG